MIAGVSFLRDALQYAFRVRARAIDLVDEEDRRDLKTVQGPHQHLRLAPAHPRPAEITSTAPSSTPNTRSTSAMKSG